MPQEREMKPDMSHVDALIGQFGGVAKIPDEELTRIGYFRPNQQELGHIAPLTLKKHQSQMETVTTTLEEKARSAPFGKIHVELPGRAVAFRHISEDDFGLVDTKLKELAQIDFMEHGDERSLSPQFDTLKNEYQRFIGNSQTTDEEAKDPGFIFDDLLLPLFAEVNNTGLGNVDYIDNFRLNGNPHNDEISSLDAEWMFGELERAKGRLTDVPQLKQIFTETMEEKYNVDDSSHLIRVRDSFSTFLRFKGMDELASALEKSCSLDEAVAFIESGRSQVVQDLVAEEKNLRAQIKVTARTDRARMIDLNQKLKAIDERKKERRTLVEGMLDYYRAPERVAQFFARKIKEVQDLLVITGQTQETVKLTLDGQPDPERDKDPGAISGDCTEGKPLPFADPQIPVYNVKVLTETDDHIGNIYLLVTTLTRERRGTKKVWHLEAIQIPQPRIDWDKAIPVLVEKLAKEAEKQEIDEITVNDVDERKSNYDYIQQAIATYLGSFASGETIEIPKVDRSKYSDFQGDGAVTFLWDKEVKRP